MWYVYIVLCNDDSLYTGITTDVERRIEEHNTKKGAKALYGKIPVRLVYNECYSSQPLALKREYEIKSWKREKKLELIKKRGR